MGLEMIYVEELKVANKKVLGVKVDLPNSPPLLLIVGGKGFIMCGFLNVDAAEKVGAIAGVVAGVKEFSDVLAAEVRAVTSKAQALGVKLGMIGEEAVSLMA